MDENLPIITLDEPHIRSKKATARRRAAIVAVLAATLIALCAVTFAVGKDTFLSGLLNKKAAAENAPHVAGIYDFDAAKVPDGCVGIVPVDLSGGGEKVAPIAPVKAAGKVLVISTHPYEAYTGEVMTYASADFSATGGEYTTAKVADFLASELRRLGIDAEYIDVGVSGGRESYAAAAEKIKNYSGGDVFCVIDVHRAALVDETGNILRPITKSDDIMAQVALVAAKGCGKYETRLSNAAALAEKMNEKCEKSAIVVTRDGVLNQDVDAVFFTAEIGSVGNGYAEAISAASAFAAGFCEMME
ncbi:MAG: stage II sporulation protein P [Clostridia bacterium]|nr:stage II sporulation protein P [Clostridia bacterium]